MLGTTATRILVVVVLATLRILALLVLALVLTVCRVHSPVKLRLVLVLLSVSNQLAENGLNVGVASSKTWLVSEGAHLVVAEVLGVALLLNLELSLFSDFVQSDVEGI